MSIPTSTGYDMVIKPKIFELARKIGEEPRDHCLNCGAWFITSRDHHDENLCVECAGLSRSWDKELNNKRQKKYAHYRKVENDKRRKENKHGSKVPILQQAVVDSV